MIRRGENGFTLIELVIAIALFALLAVEIYSSLNGIISTKKAVDSTAQAERAGRYIIQRIVRELSNASLVGLVNKPCSRSSTTLPAGSKTLLVGGTAKSGNIESDSIRFAGVGAAEQLSGTLGNAGNVEIFYSLVENSDQRAGDIGQSGARSMVLVREETPAGVCDPKIFRKSRVVLPLTADVIGLKFRYRRGGRWNNKSGQVVSSMPEAIEVRLKLRAENGQVLTFSTAVAIPLRS